MRARHDAASALPERSAAADPKRQETATVIPQNRFVMEELTLTTPALLFSAVSLILLAYTNRFLSYAQLVRTRKEQHLRTCCMSDCSSFRPTSSARRCCC